MGKKRRSEDSTESNTPAKNVPEFNGTVFKAMLKDPTTAMKGEYMLYAWFECVMCDLFISSSTLHRLY